MTAALIISTESSLTRDRFDPMEKMGNVSAIRRQILVFQQAGIERIVIVAGRHAREIEKHVARMGVVCLRNEKYESAQMLESVKIGLAYLMDKNFDALITPTNVPFFSAETVAQLSQTTASVAVPVCEGVFGHPLFLSGALFPFVLAYSGEGGLSAAVKASGERVAEVAVADEGVAFCAVGGDNAAQMAEKHSLNKLRVKAKLSLAYEQAFFGPGTMQLLTLLGETRSLRHACQQMGLSYSKGLHMLAVMEEELGYQVVQSRKGGRAGGESVITPAGLALMEKYAAFSQDCAEAIRGIFYRHFHEEDGGKQP